MYSETEIKVSVKEGYKIAKIEFFPTQNPGNINLVMDETEITLDKQTIFEGLDITTFEFINTESDQFRFSKIEITYIKI